MTGIVELVLSSGFFIFESKTQKLVFSLLVSQDIFTVTQTSQYFCAA